MKKAAILYCMFLGFYMLVPGLSLGVRLLDLYLW